ncbi:hypothetical protein KYI11_07835 [Macrococcoides bohemicum]|uniref:Uncharacterized protein n=1 Tax=Macrococcoides bohemicum TaxID=1903056 RepID=A0A4R5Y7R9_9STAP|nr:hypothetical protein [Macrococcus]ATD30175.1 hypothetical protein BHM04_02860 [Macrococcus sp. IME1552]QRN50118.1 hypothetical protein HT586_07875 [Macrococcus bohemicus]QYA41550.1 hypothetical protein KYI11_07835 [Macrococcus bohemicus]QYA43975.1 hypothetical protein KYI13_07780 [Macrococcus bohemicus]TDL40644.1 hypothetical protein EVU91_01765 [Macrococcus bohemicus]
MSTGFIVFIIFTVISIVSSINENANKQKAKQVKRPISSKQQVNSKNVFSQLQKSMGNLEKEFTDFKKNPEAKLKEIEQRIEKGNKQTRNVEQQVKNKIAEAKDQERPIERSAAKKIQAFEEKIQTKETLSLAERIATIEADSHLSPRQKMNRINMIRMEDDIDRASSLVDFTPENTLKGIIYSEILGPPKARR